jgi:type II secretory pathway component PulK
MFSFFRNTSKGNVIVFALSTLAVMTLSATVLAASTLLELRKSRNVENAIFAKYDAEGETEHVMYLINQALRTGHDLDYIKAKI